MIPHRLLALLLPLALAGAARADDVLLAGGSRLAGTVLADDEQGVRLLAPGGDVLTLSRADVKEVTREADAPGADRILRYRRGDGKGPAGLQTAVLHLVHPGTGRRVDLVGAVHIADEGYYRAVQRLLEQDDAVLYEMVKPKDAKPGDAAAPETGGVRELQSKMAGWLGLVFQLEHIAYDRPHFVHADLTAEEFLADPGSGALTGQVKGMEPMLKMVEGMVEGMLKGEGAQAQARRRSLKVMLAQMMGSMGARAAQMLGGETAELLIDKRNAACVERLLALPEDKRTVAVFYGAAHLPDLVKRLEALGYRSVAGRWLTAWDTTAPAATDAAPAKPAEPAAKEPQPSGR